ncbi:RNA polymerase sigma factor [Streptacidiphilus jiangxiensis]|uniref:RNA polymerase sigma factor, sigma-70 family n=1 Tax=Streptacidiphilus jiangxiensis TaxID=235985 RepID=A0A1H7ZRM5_STRJI|nr:RNA polymerase sigma factor [Streptacidiphilus jiangxiensis]SEM60159.1 RNA polymerase sigma factor, sigma-70 family [Streptacidiphilus jiangxiensis]
MADAVLASLTEEELLTCLRQQPRPPVQARTEISQEIVRRAWPTSSSVLERVFEPGEHRVTWDSACQEANRLLEEVRWPRQNLDAWMAEIVLLTAWHEPRAGKESRTRALAALLEHHRPWLHRTLARRLRNQDRAEDVVQDLVIDLWNALEAGNLPQSDRFRAWIGGFVRHRTARYWTETGKAELLGLTEDTVGELADQRLPLPLPPGHHAVRLTDFHQLFPQVQGTLEPEDAQLFELRVQRGMTIAETAAVLGRPDSQMERAARKLDVTLGARFRMLLLVSYGDRGRCAALTGLLDRHRHDGRVRFTRLLCDEVAQHLRDCTRCREQLRCLHKVPVTECGTCLMCRHGRGDCGLCRREMARLYWRATPVLVPLVFGAAFRERIGDGLRLAAAAGSAGSNNASGGTAGSPVSRPPGRPVEEQRGPGAASRPRFRRRLVRSLAGVTAVVTVVAILLAVRPGQGGHGAGDGQAVAASMPLVAYATPTGILTRQGAAGEHLVTKVPTGTQVTELSWSMDHHWLGWTTLPTTSGGGTLQVHLTSLADGVSHSWDCAACTGIGFLGDQLYSTQNATSLTTFPQSGAAPGVLTLQGLPPAVSTLNPDQLSLEVLRPTSAGNELLLFWADSTGGAPVMRLLRADARGLVASVTSGQLPAAPGGDRAQGEPTSLSPDGSMLAYGGNVLGGDVCESSDSVTVVNLGTGQQVASVQLPGTTAHPTRVVSVWTDGHGTVYAGAFPQAFTCPPVASPSPSASPGAPAPEIYRLDGGTWTDTHTTASAEAETATGWSALIPVAAPAPTASASAGSARQLRLPTDTTAFAWAPASWTTPVLGRLWSTYQQGFGQVAPVSVFNGGDPTGAIQGMHWTSWGGPQAVGTGTGWYPGTNVANGHPSPARLVASDLGLCDGILAYRAVDWYFPQESGTKPTAHYSICN